MKIVYLVASSDVSGGQRVIFQQAEGLAKESQTVTLICPEPKPNWFPILNATWEQTPFSESIALKEADISVATYWTTVMQAVTHFTGPVFHLCQGYEADFSFNLPVKAKIEAVYAQKTHKLSVSPHVSDRLKSIGYDPVSYIGQTFDPDEFPPLEKRAFDFAAPIFLLPGIFEADLKGARETLKALAALRQNGSRFQLLRVSTWPQSEAEKTILSADRYFQRLTPAEMADTYRTSDLLIDGSHPEDGFGLHVLEALSSGLPVLISDTPGHRHIARNAADYFECGQEKDIKAKLKSLLNRPLRLRKLSKMGPLEAYRFSTEKVTHVLLQIFEQSLAQEKSI
jgi:glycosyltransferase involved in cell wall biosynthesis